VKGEFTQKYLSLTRDYDIYLSIMEKRRRQQMNSRSCPVTGCEMRKHGDDGKRIEQGKNRGEV
jgi:hypothetical protein